MEIKAPTFPESIADGSIAQWHHQQGDAVSRDELLVDIETDKVVIEVFAPENGVLTAILKSEGETVLSEEVIATFEAGAVAATSEPAADEQAAAGEDLAPEDAFASPAARKMAAESDLNISRVSGSGRDGRITKEDVARALVENSEQPTAPAPAGVAPTIVTPAAAPMPETADLAPGERVERRVPMTRLRASIAKRLVEAQQSAAMLTTFNDVDMDIINCLSFRWNISSF